jgi:hypothetical protein
MMEETKKQDTFFDLKTPLTHNLQTTNANNDKYQEVAFDIKKLWQPDKIIITPLVLSPTRAVRNMPNQSPNTLNVPP